MTYAKNLDDATLDRSYDYDNVGRMWASHTGKEARWHIGLESYTGADGPYAFNAAYDQWGNITQRNGWGVANASYSASYSNNKRTGLSYDAAGNLTNDGSQTYTYDATGQQATASGNSLSQFYDGDGLRGKRTENGTTVYYLRSSILGGQVISELNSSGGWNRGYVYLGGQLVAIQYGGVSWVHQDPVTKSQRITNSGGTVTSTVDLDPWGGETGRSSNQAFQPHRFTSYERDANSGDDAMMRRHQSSLSRFSQPDPYDGSYDLADPQSMNRYAYTQNDPVNFIDPSGLLMASPRCTLEWVWIPHIEGGGDWDLREVCGNEFYGDDTGRRFPDDPGIGSEGPQNPSPTPTPNPYCGVNPITGQPGFTRNPIGQPGHLRAPVNGRGEYNAPRGGNPRGHRGLDIAGRLNASPVYSNRDGTVSFAGRTAGDAGWLVIINHAGGAETRYAHLQANSIPAGVTAGSQVKQGQQIGIVGNTGNAGSAPPHVHFGVNKGRMDPEIYLNRPC